MKPLWSRLLMVFFYYMHFDVNGHVCPVQNQTETPRFTEPLSNAYWIEYDTAVKLLCCAEGYDYIKWFTKTNGDVWKPFTPNSTGIYAPELLEDNQVLEFSRVGMDDEAFYQCNAFKHGTVALNHTSKLHVTNCQTSSRGPVLMEPFPLNQTIYEYGGKLTLDCTGYFGCQNNPDDPFNQARWSVLGTAKYISQISPRYHVVRSTREDGAVVQSTLTITSVTQEDTERTFICVVGNAQQIHGQTKEFVRITKGDKSVITELELALIVGGCVLFMTFLIIALCIRCRCSPQFRLVINRIIPKCGPKYIDSENIIWNLYIHHADEDEGIATQWKNELENLGYKVRITADMKGGHSEMNDFKEASMKSALVVFLYSDYLLEEEMADLFLQTVVIERNGKDIMFLEKTSFKPREIRDWARDAKIQKGEPFEDNSVEVSIEEDSDEIVEEKRKIDDIRFWRTIPRFKVPKEGASKRVKKNFLCSLRNNIPRFKKTDPEKGGKKVAKDRSGSNKPLLEDPPESPRSPDGLENPTIEMSPGMISSKVNEFDYDETSVMKIVGSGNFDGHRGMVAKAECRNPEHGFIDHQNAEVFLEIQPSINKNIRADAVVHDQQINNAANENDNQKLVIETGDTGRNVEEEMARSKEVIFSMSGEDEPKSGSPNAESAYTSSFEEPSREGNSTSENGNSSCFVASSAHSSSGFGSQGSETSSPPIIPDQSFSPGDQCNNRFHKDFAPNVPQPRILLDEQCNERGALNGTGPVVKNKKNLEVTINSTNKPSNAGSPESGYMTTSADRFNSGGAFLPQNKGAVG